MKTEIQLKKKTRKQIKSEVKDMGTDYLTFDEGKLIDIVEKIADKALFCWEKCEHLDSLVSKEDYTIDEVVYLTKAHGIKKAAPKTVRKACADGRLPAYKLDAAWRIRRQAVLKVLKDGIPPETTTKRPQRQGRAATRYSPPLRLDQNLPRGQVL